MTITRQSGLAVLSTLLFFFVFALTAHRHGIRLSFDSYYYVEFAKEFRLHAPTSFGSAWPYGWPLLGTLASLTGMSPYHGLLVFSLVSLVGMVALTGVILPWERLGGGPGTLLLCATATTAPLSSLVTGVLSEIPFSFLLLGFAFCLARWPEPWALVAACVFALAAFTIRYAGGLLLAMLVFWVLVNFRSLRATGRLSLAVFAVAVACATAAGLLWWNYRALGMVSGHPRGTGTAPKEWLGIAADFGWSLPAALGGLGFREALGFSTVLKLPLGVVFFASLILGGFIAWRQGPSKEIRALGAVVAGYAAGLVILRCQGEFDALHNARMFVPLLFPCLVLVSWKMPRSGLVATSGVLLLANAALNFRGASLEIGANVDAVPAIVATAPPGELIAVNDHALTLAALVPNRVVRVWPLNLDSGPQSAFIVIAAPPLDRSGRPGLIPPEWSQARDALLASGRWSERLNSNSLLVLERLGAKP
jgi:hypothetical protein